KKQRDPNANGFPDPPVAALVGLEGLCGDLTTATNINRALSQIFLLMAQGRIPQKQAVAFGYITQLLLQTVPGIRSEYVSVFGYRDWETQCKSNIPPFPHMPPAPPESPAPQSPSEPATPADQTPSPDYADIFRRS